MGVVFFAGAEHGLSTTSSSRPIEEVAGTGCSVVSSPVKTGNYAYRVNTSSAASFLFGGHKADGSRDATAGCDISTYYCEFWFRCATKSSASTGELIADFRRTLAVGSGSKGSIRLNSNGTLSVYDQNNTLVSTSTTVLNENTWYHIGFMGVSGSSDTSYELRINNVTELSGAMSQGSATLYGPRLGRSQDRNGTTTDYYFDDLVISDDAFIGSSYGVEAMNIMANGSTMSWISGTASTADQVGEYPVTTSSESTYLKCTTGGTAMFVPYPIDVCDIKAVKPVALVAEDSAVTSSLKLRLTSNGTSSDTTAYNVAAISTTPWETLAKVHLTDPATSASWKYYNLNDVQFGLVEANSVAMRMIWGGLMVLRKVTLAEISLPPLRMVAQETGLGEGATQYVNDASFIYAGAAPTLVNETYKYDLFASDLGFAWNAGILPTIAMIGDDFLDVASTSTSFGDDLVTWMNANGYKRQHYSWAAASGTVDTQVHHVRNLQNAYRCAIVALGTQDVLSNRVSGTNIDSTQDLLLDALAGLPTSCEIIIVNLDTNLDSGQPASLAATWNSRLSTWATGRSNVNIIDWNTAVSGTPSYRSGNFASSSGQTWLRDQVNTILTNDVPASAGDDDQVLIAFGDGFGTGWDGPFTETHATASAIVAGSSSTTDVTTWTGSGTLNLSSVSGSFPSAATNVPAYGKITLSDGRMAYFQYTNKASSTQLTGVKLLALSSPGDSIIYTSNPVEVNANWRRNSLIRSSTKDLSSGYIADAAMLLDENGIAGEVSVDGSWTAPTDSPGTTFRTYSNATEITVNNVTVAFGGYITVVETATAHGITRPGQNFILTGASGSYTALNSEFRVLTILSPTSFVFTCSCTDGSAIGSIKLRVAYNQKVADPYSAVETTRIPSGAIAIPDGGGTDVTRQVLFYSSMTNWGNGGPLTSFAGIVYSDDGGYTWVNASNSGTYTGSAIDVATLDGGASDDLSCSGINNADAFPTTGGQVEIDTTTGVATIAYSSRSGNTLNDCTLISGSGNTIPTTGGVRARMWGNNVSFTDNFQYLWPWLHSGTVYVLSIGGTYRNSAAYLAKCAQADVLKIGEWWYWDGADWTRTRANAKPVFGTNWGAYGSGQPVSEPSFMYHSGIEKWVAPIFNEARGMFTMRTADLPQGPWSREQDVVDMTDHFASTIVSTVGSANNSGAGGVGTLTDSTQLFDTALWVGATVTITAGTGSGQTRTVASLTSTVLTMTTAWTTIPDNTSTYKVQIPFSGAYGGMLHPLSAVTPNDPKSLFFHISLYAPYATYLMEATIGPEEVSSSQNVTITESIATSVQGYISTSDSITVSENINIILQSDVNASDLCSISEQISHEIEYKIEVSEMIASFEVFSNDSNIGNYNSDHIDTEESIELIVPVNLNVSDNISISESGIAVAALILNISDSVTSTESISGFLPDLFVSVQENLLYTESIRAFHIKKVRFEKSSSFTVTNLMDL